MASEITLAGESRMAGPFGALVDGLDLRRATDPELRRLADLLFGNRILVVRGQTLTNDDYVAFGRKWGEPVVFISPKNTLGSHPEMIVQSNSAATMDVLKNNANHWHCDSSYEKVAATVTMLLGVLAPKAGGETLFCDLVAAYDDLPEATKQRIDGLEAMHMPGRSKLAAGESMVTPDRMTPELMETSNKFGPVKQPIVRRHLITGRKALYGLGGTPYEIIGMEREAGQALIAELKAHATQDRYVQHYKLMPGEVLLWDNFSVMHRATPIDYTDEPEAKRLNYRISVKGAPKFMAAAAA
jgi:taurine dioxygenase